MVLPGLEDIHLSNRERLERGSHGPLGVQKCRNVQAEVLAIVSDRPTLRAATTIGASEELPWPQLKCDRQLAHGKATSLRGPLHDSFLVLLFGEGRVAAEDGLVYFFTCCTLPWGGHPSRSQGAASRLLLTPWRQTPIGSQTAWNFETWIVTKLVATASHHSIIVGSGIELSCIRGPS